MRKNLSNKALLYPLPVLILGTYDENGVANAMNAAWGTLADYDKLYICCDASHKTTENFLKTNAITVSIGTKEYLIDEDYVGIESGKRNLNKLEHTRLTPIKSEFVNAPLFKELPLALECEVISYDKETANLFLQVKNVSVDESILTNSNHIDVKKLNPISYDSSNHKYYTLGEVVGDAFSDGMKLKK